MTEEQQRIAIAEACGWTCCGQVQGLNPHGLVPWRKIDDYTTRQVLNHEVPIDTLPDYLNNLNAMHEAEKSLNNLSFYRSFLYLVVLDDPKNKSNEPAWATAAQRAEAFLRTIGKWTTNQPTEP